MHSVRRLADYPWVVVRLRCDVCKRAGAYRLARMAVKFGAEILLDDLVVRLLRLSVARRAAGQLRRALFRSAADLAAGHAGGPHARHRRRQD